MKKKKKTSPRFLWYSLGERRCALSAIWKGVLSYSGFKKKKIRNNGCHTLSLVRDKWTLLGMIRREWFSERGNEISTLLNRPLAESRWLVKRNRRGPQRAMTCHFRMRGVWFPPWNIPPSSLGRNNLSNQRAFKKERLALNVIWGREAEVSFPTNQ